MSALLCNLGDKSVPEHTIIIIGTIQCNVQIVLIFLFYFIAFFVLVLAFEMKFKSVLLIILTCFLAKPEFVTTRSIYVLNHGSQTRSPRTSGKEIFLRTYQLILRIFTITLICIT